MPTFCRAGAEWAKACLKSAADGPWQPGSLLHASLQLCPGCRSLPAALSPCARPAVVTTLDMYDPARHRKATLVRSGWEGKGCRWPEEPGRSRGWLYAERPGAWQGGEAASLGRVWYWGACRGRDHDPGCHAGGCPPWGHTQRYQRVVVLGRAAVTTELQRLERPTSKQHHTGGPGFPMASWGTQLRP